MTASSTVEASPSQSPPSARTSTAPSVKAGSSAFAACLLEQAAGGLLGALDVGLVERVDAQETSGHGGGHLPQEQLRAERPGHLDLRAVWVHELVGAAGVVVLALTLQPHHRHVSTGAGDLGVVLGLDDDGQDPGALLAGALGDELLGPVGQPHDAGAVVQQDQLVAQRGGARHRDAEAQGRVGLVVGREDVGDGLGVVEQRLDVGPGQARGDQAEGRQRGVAAAHVGVGVDDAVAAVP